MTPPFQALVFDMDGVLADSEPIYYAAMQSVLSPLGIEVTDEHQRQVMGSSIESTWRYFAETFSLDGPLDALVEAYDLSLRRMLAEIHQALPGVRQLIPQLRARHIPIAVASSSTPEWIDALLGGLGLQDAFDAAVSAREAGASKPAPDVYLLAAKRLNANPQRCIAIEDTPTGLASAKAAGMFAVQTRSASSAFPPLLGADLVIDSLLDFPLSLLDLAP
jgi:HAD superfamily hydrolase (TIGR01509 family)